ncbi:MAG: helix-turn-helix domain-containing protein [Planctomycetota bacterium]
MTRIGLKIFYLRTREQQLSQQQLSKVLGIRQATLSHVEQGTSLPSCTLLLQLCKHFDVTPTYLLDDERDVVPLPTERWGLRNALVTVGMWIEAPEDAVVETADGKLLCPLQPREAFYDQEAMALRVEKGERARGRAAVSRLRRRRRDASQELAIELKRELRTHPRRRPVMRA